LWRSLRRRGKRYNKRAGKNVGRGLIPNRIDISERPRAWRLLARKATRGRLQPYTWKLRLRIELGLEKHRAGPEFRAVPPLALTGWSAITIRYIPEKTFYKEQWLKLLDMSADIRAFIAANEAQLKAKD